MKIKKAIQILSAHNKWRRGGKGKMTEPKELGIAIDTILDYHLEIEKQEFIDNYLDKHLINHNLPYGTKYLNLLEKYEDEAEKKWNIKLKKRK